jgi:alginate O-acetyltransferase complex protein AlgI
MVFSSLLFLFIYLPVVLGIYSLVPSKWRNVWLFAVNLVFYGWGEPIYILLMFAAISANYLFALLIGKSRNRVRRAKLFLVLAVAFDLALLLFFKYYDFIAENLSAVGINGIRPLGVTLPLGISFYLFQIMAYIIDVYRGDVDAQKNYIKVGNAIALFPQLIAGPIVRYRDIKNQLDERKSNADQFASGIRKFVIGLSKKVLLANNIGALWDVYAAKPVSELSVFGSWLGILAFTFQIYFDFSGYSDMAIGLGRMLGFEFLENFNYPYISKSITEFWRRWHISLSTWFRDYVYIPLGGNRKGVNRQIINILIVWALTGVWHGASWNFILWGIYYAVLLIVEKLFLLKALDRQPGILAHFYTMLFVILGWALFAIEDISAALSYISVMLGISGARFMSSDALYYLRSFGPVLVITILASTPILKGVMEKVPVRWKSIAVPVFIAVFLLLTTAYLVDSTYNPFLYFRF